MTRNEIARQQIACTKLLRTPQLTRRVQFGVHSASQVPLFSITKHCSTYIVDLQTSEPKLSLLKRQPSMASSHTPTFAILQCTKNGLESGLSDFFPSTFSKSSHKIHAMFIWLGKVCDLHLRRRQTRCLRSKVFSHCRKV